MSLPLFVIEEKELKNMFQCSDKSVTFYWSDGEHNNQVDMSSKRLVQLVSDYANKQMEIAKKEGRVRNWRN